MVHTARDYQPTYEVDLDVLKAAARSVPGWSLAYFGPPKVDEDLCQVVELRFSWRGGWYFPISKLMVDGVSRVHEYVQNGTAHVWVTYKSALAIAGSK